MLKLVSIIILLLFNFPNWACRIAIVGQPYHPFGAIEASCLDSYHEVFGALTQNTEHYIN